MVKIFSDINHTNGCFGHSHKEIETKTKIRKLDLIKITSVCIAKEILNKRWEKIFAIIVTNKGLIFKMYKQFTQLNNKKRTH